MENITLILIGISALFFILLLVKEIFNKRKKKFCAICTAVSLTWIILLVLYFLDIFNDKIILALLIGHTSLGIFYLVENKVKEKFKLFRLPFLLTLIILFYYLIQGFIFESLLFIIILWVLFILIYSFKNNKGLNLFAKKIIECCKRW